MYFKVCRIFKSSHKDVITCQVCILQTQIGMKSKNLIINHKNPDDNKAKIHKPK